MNWQLQNFDSNQFIEKYWQKAPCLIRQAFAIQESPVSPEELAGLACEEEVHSRLVLEKGGTSPWQLRYGPFNESDFTSLPESFYSLLVSECEKWLPEFSELIQAFNFLPRWRIDDIMLSYAPPGSSVGAHIDEYDVFLLQIQGCRQWSYSNQRIDNPELLPGLDLAILQAFSADQKNSLLPGDMLYLPPGVGHHGIAEDACITCSIGFRAPTASEVLESLALEIDRKELGSKRYQDPQLERNRHCAEITSDELDQFRTLVSTLLEQPKSVWLDAVGKLLTDTVVHHENEPVTRFAQLSDQVWMINVDSKMLFHRDASAILFYSDGEVCELPYSDEILNIIQQLCTSNLLSAELVEQCQEEPQVQALLIDLVNRGTLLQADER